MAGTHTWNYDKVNSEFSPRRSRDKKVAFLPQTEAAGGKPSAAIFFIGIKEVSRSAWCSNAFCSPETKCHYSRRVSHRWVRECVDDCPRAGALVGRAMRDLTKRGVPAAPSRPPKGIAFEIADLLLIGSWAVLHGLGMSVRLDHGAEDEEYEEVIAFQAEVNPLSRLIMWRNAEAVFVQPLAGRRQRYDTISEALEDLLPEPRTPTTDIVATEWPAS